MVMDLKATFQKVYANLPLGSRTEIVAVIDGAPMTWNVIYIEVQEETEKSKQILSFLEKIGVLKK